jgi:hypothetical protein
MSYIYYKPTSVSSPNKNTCALIDLLLVKIQEIFSNEANIVLCIQVVFFIMDWKRSMTYDM